MFIHDDPYFVKPFEKYTTNCSIPTGDIGAYQQHQKHNWVYNKLELYKTLGYETFPMGINPKSFPVFVKPIYNLFGMSIGAKRVNSANELSYKPGFLWMPVFVGKQISTDYAVNNGKVVWGYSMLGNKDKNDSFTHWTYKDCKQKHEIDWLQKYLHDFTGMVNVESIGDKIIEVHLRLSNQFVDLYGSDFIKSVINLYENNKWTKTFKNKTGCSYVVRIPKNIVPNNKTIKMHFKSTRRENVFYTIQENVPLKKFIDNDDTTYRIAVINGRDRKKCKKMANKIYKNAISQLKC